MYVVILAGGGGTRLWPLSRPETPKPFLPLLDDRSLLRRTVDRIVDHDELAVRADDVCVVTDRRYAQLVREQVPGIRCLPEPAPRNTAAAIALATAAIERPGDAVMLVLAADHSIQDDGVFRGVIADAESELAGGALGIESPLVTLGIQITRPATEYGYLVPDTGRKQERRLTAYALKAFVEKPNQERAIQLRNQPGVAWNGGIFLWKRAAIRAALTRYTSLLTLIEPVMGSEFGLQAAYDAIRQPLSIDHAVMEGAAEDGLVVMGAMNVGWDDLGSWTALLQAIGGVGTGSVIQPGEPAEATDDDLVVERIDGRLVVTSGPRGILASSPVALLRGAAAGGRAAVEALIGRVTSWEDRT